MEKRIVLCADDYGQAPAISQGILALVKKNRLSAVSCMVTTPYWLEHALWLMPFRSQVDIGLHFNLTEPGSSLSLLMMKSLLRQVSYAAIVAELNTQIDSFVAGMGHLPHFIDGHQHVHQFPVIRDALISVYKERLQKKKPYIRIINEKLRPIDLLLNMKKAVVQGMGTQALKHLLLQHQIPHNQSFSGMYSFSRASEYKKLFPHFLADIRPGGLIMCHPGLLSLSPDDPIAKARYGEYQYFISDQFLIDCRAEDVAISRFALDGAC